MKYYYLFLLLIPFFCCRNEPREQTVHDGEAYYKSALRYLDQGKADSAYLTFDLAKDIYLRAGDTLSAASCLIQSAVTLTEQGDYFGSQETSLQALNYLNQNIKKHWQYLAINYSNLGNATALLKDYPKALEFTDLAIKFSTDSATSKIYLNNKAASFFDFRKFKAALDIFQQITSQTEEGTVEYARALTNLAKTKWRIDSSYDAAADLNKALRIRLVKNDLWGQNSSYTHLAEYYELNKRDSALIYAQKRYTLAKELNSADDQIKGLDKLIELSPAAMAKSYFDTYKHLHDSVQNARAAAKNQFALIRYEVEKNKADNLQLQKENAEKANNLIKQRILTVGITIAFIVVVITGTIWYKKRKQRLELETQNQIKANQLKTSRKVHDVVANGIYYVMKDVEYNPVIDREHILDKLEDMYHKSRDISYETEESTEQNRPYHDRLASLIKSFDTDFREIFIVGNESELWRLVNDKVRENIHQVVQELMVNMDKHSRADNVVIRFEKDNDHVHIYYTDDGIGLKKDVSYGNGLTNTVSRIESLGGTITFVNEQGLKVEISVPFL